MAYLSALAQGGPPAPGGDSPMAPNPASQGLGAPPKLPGLPPPPTNAGAMPTGAPTKTKMTAGADVIQSLRDLQGFVPELYNEINAWIGQVKSATSQKPGQNPGPAPDAPGVPGALSLDQSELSESGGPGAF